MLSIGGFMTYLNWLIFVIGVIFMVLGRFLRLFLAPNRCQNFVTFDVDGVAI
jgi:hypothetical protein